MIAGPVVIGVDYSPAIDRASSWLRTLVPDARIIVVHAGELAVIPGYMRRLVSAPEYTTHEAEADATRLREWVTSHGLTGAQTIIREGRPDLVLRDAARESGADLIVVGAHRGDERPWRRLGTVAERLLRAAETSLLVVHPSIANRPQRILVALDDAAITARVLEIAGGFADRFKSALTAVHVLSNAAYSHMLSMCAIEEAKHPNAHPNIEEDLAAEALRWLRALWHNVRGSEHLEAEISHGDPAGEILSVAERMRADLIVMGRYGAGRVIPALLGSVVGSVAQHARCPVLVVADAARSGNS